MTICRPRANSSWGPGSACAAGVVWNGAPAALFEVAKDAMQ